MIMVRTLNIRFSASFASWIQSVVYGAAVGAGSPFALAQAAAAGGIAVAGFPIQVISAWAMGLGGWLALF